MDYGMNTMHVKEARSGGGSDTWDRADAGRLIHKDAAVTLRIYPERNAGWSQVHASDGSDSDGGDVRKRTGL